MMLSTGARSAHSGLAELARRLTPLLKRNSQPSRIACCSDGKALKQTVSTRQASVASEATSNAPSLGTGPIWTTASHRSPPGETGPGGCRGAAASVWFGDEGDPPQRFRDELRRPSIAGPVGISARPLDELHRSRILD